MKPNFVSMIATVAALWAFPALALDLHSARAAGQIGEKSDGYVTVLKSSPEVSSLVAEVNAKRRAEYQKISEQNGQPVDVVAKLAAGQIVSKLESGASYQDASGNWKKK